MTVRRLALALIALLATLVALVWVLLRPPARTPPDLPALNDIVSRLAVDAAELGRPSYEPPRPPDTPDYAVLDTDGRLLVATGPAAPTSLVEAIARQDTVLDLRDGDRLTGQVLFATGDEVALTAAADHLRWVCTILVVLLGAAAALALWRLDRSMLRPFREMGGFARQVAAGDLDAPLRMDKANAFGAFTEAFDLMRQELAAARQRERQADRAKRELVASLGHDMKTPIASIKAVAELMAARNRDPATAARLAVIDAKADQLDALASDLLEGALRELEVLPVNPREVSSHELAGLLAEADHLGWADGIEFPDCLVRVDPLRWAQAVGNVVANAYKYGAAPLTVTARIVGSDALEVALADAGPGVGPDELALVTRKFYRGAAGAGKPGAGLGLYLARHLMERMGGQLACGDAAPGFKVTLRAPLA